MELTEINIDELGFTTFGQSFLSLKEDNICGVIESKDCAWIVKGHVIYIISLRNGQIISSFDISRLGQNEDSRIKTAEHFYIDSNEVILAAVLEKRESTGHSIIALISLKEYSVLNCIEVNANISSIQFLQKAECRRSLLQYFKGCLALGCGDGEVLLLDLKLHEVLPLNITLASSVIYNFDTPLPTIRNNFIKCQQNGKHVALRMQNIANSCRVRSIHCISLILGLCVGYNDGRLAIFDVLEMQLICIVEPVHGNIPLIKISSIEPRDDPRPCLYLWAVHQNENELTTVLHAIMYENRIVDCTGFQTFENFQLCNVRHSLSLENGHADVLSCQTILNQNPMDEDNGTCLCTMSWFSNRHGQNKILIFDLNQWYKAEMPLETNIRENPSYIAIYILKGDQKGFKLHIKHNTIAHFNSMERYEEHYYPNSISFECVVIVGNGFGEYNWEGAQNKLINTMRLKKCEILYDPAKHFKDIIKTGLAPLFIELNGNSTNSKKFMQEVILSFAIENNCHEILRDSCKYCFDSNDTGTIDNSSGLSLSFLVEWSWKRATCIKERCNYLSRGLLSCNGYSLDIREQKELGFLNRQLRLLVEFLYNLNETKRTANKDLFGMYKALQTAADYHDILLWMFTNGLLPDTLFRRKCINGNPFTALQSLYVEKRKYFYKINHQLVSKKIGCTLIFIDKFIERECNSSTLQELWNKNDSDGIYPPTSIDSLLRVMLLPDLNFHKKCSLLMYFFFDLQFMLKKNEDKTIIGSLNNFSIIFKLPSYLLKTIQCFWNLDHQNFLEAVDMFMSPNRTNSCILPHWYDELFVESLLMQNSPKLALRVLDVCSTISPALKTKTLLFNNLLNEAFYLARNKTENNSLLNLFFRWCVCAGKYSVLRELALTDRESNLLQNIIKQSKVEESETLHLAYLLQRSKYVEAISYMNSLSKSNRISHMDMTSCLQNSEPNSGSNLLMSALNFTMNPVTQNLTDVYFLIKTKLNRKESLHNISKPFSCHLINKNSNNLCGEVYYSSVLSSNFASSYGDGCNNNNSADNSLVTQNTPFLRKAQNVTNYLDVLFNHEISYPAVYRVCEKRSLSKNCFYEHLDHIDAKTLNPTKRRRYLSDECSMTTNKELNDQLRNEKPTYIKEHVSPNQSFFTKPLSLSERNPTTDRSQIKSFKEIHGILKTHTPEPQESFQSCFEEGKLLRFNQSSIETTRNKKGLEIDVNGAYSDVNVTDTKYYSLSDVNTSKHLFTSSDSISSLDEKSKRSLGDNTTSIPAFLYKTESKIANDFNKELRGIEKIPQNFNDSATPFATSTTYEGLKKMCSEELNSTDPEFEMNAFKDKDAAINTLRKINECTTVVGSITNMEFTGDSFKLSEKCNKVSKINSGNQQNKCIDTETTLGMTSYEFTEVESHCVHNLLENSNSQNINECQRSKYCYKNKDQNASIKYESRKYEMQNEDTYEILEDPAINTKSNVQNNSLTDIQKKLTKSPAPPKVQDVDLIKENILGTTSRETSEHDNIFKRTRRRTYTNSEPEKDDLTDTKPKTRKRRGASVPPDGLQPNTSDISTEKELEKLLTSDGPKKNNKNRGKKDSENTPKKLRGVSEPPETSELNKPDRPNKRGKSVPPSSQIDKSQPRTLLDPIAENTIIDSPSSRTRSRMRLNSCEVELNSSLILNNSLKTTRKRRQSNDSCYKESTTRSISEAPESDDSESNTSSRSVLTNRRITRSALKKTSDQAII